MPQMMMKSKYDVGDVVAVVYEGELKEKLFIVKTVRFCSNAEKAYIEYEVRHSTNSSFVIVLKEDLLFSDTQIQAMQSEIEDTLDGMSWEVEYALPYIVNRLEKSVSIMESLHKQFSEVINAKRNSSN